MGSTYLTLTNKVLRRLNEVELTAASFASARGIHATVKDAVVDSVRKINTQKFEWPFNKASGSQILEADKATYTWPADFKIADWESFIISNDGTLATSTTSLKQISREDYQNYLRNIDTDTDGSGIPQYVAELSGGGFAVSPEPDEAYTLLFDYFINTIDLVDHDDTCTIPELYDYVIVDGALHFIYAFLDNTNRSILFENNFKKGLDHMAYILIPKSPTMVGGQVNDGVITSRVKIFND